MPAIRLRSDATIGLLLADLFVLWFALGSARDAEAPTWIRVVSLVVVVLAVAFAVHSLVSLLRRRRA
ncbi:hypothetical protein ACFQ0K_15710 [Nocardioides caeni]|uniref:hypothetical protein n=1 Tax=Nocardioides caeni TaxID=574700 RepID=UPI0013053B54|nr:hypothetical protein [Nocardioides caeni]